MRRALSRRAPLDPTLGQSNERVVDALGYLLVVQVSGDPMAVLGLVVGVGLVLNPRGDREIAIVQGIQSHDVAHVKGIEPIADALGMLVRRECSLDRADAQ